MEKLTIVSFNAGLLSMRLCGWTILEPAPYVEERFEEISKALAELDADIILLQEVYRKEHCERIVRELGYPYAVQTRDAFPMRSGLMILSKHPILEGGYIPFKTKLIEDRIADKGMLVARIATPLGEVAIVNVHPTAGGRQHPEHPTVNRIRSAQLRQAMDVLEQMSANTSMRIMGGDFNAGPEASTENFEEILREGYEDTVKQGTMRFTWDPANPLNAHGPHAHCPPQRCDHVFVQGQQVRATSKIVLTDPVVPVPQGSCTLSDHYGVITHIEVDR